MGERGPIPKPVRRRRNKRPAGDKRVLVARPAKPRTLTGEAKAEWDRIVPEIEAMGLVATVDRAMLIRYCRSWADWCQVDENLQKTGLLVKGRRDALVRNPLFLLRSDLESVLSDLSKQMGLTPASRLRAGVKHEMPEPDELPGSVTAIAEYKERLGYSN